VGEAPVSFAKNHLPPMTRALMSELLVHHSIKTTYLLLNMTLSGVPVSKAQVRNARQSSLREQRAARSDDVARVPAAIPVPPAPAKPRGPLTFEEQMARVAAGARLVEVPRFSRPAPDYTLGGVASGML
jgi:hypothetical protein